MPKNLRAISTCLDSLYTMEILECKICNNQSNFFSNAIILKKYKIAYFKCETCGFIQTEYPFWLDEAYLNPLADADVGLVSRNLYLSNFTKIIILFFYKKNEKFLDYGGGSGLFVRLMRDKGFNFYYYDKYSLNIFAKGFEVDLKNNFSFEVITVFEVFEHLYDPILEIKKLLNFTDNILFTTEIIPKSSPKPENWYYYSLDSGQHISFFTLKSLLLIAKKFNLNLISNGTNIHLLSKKKISRNLFNVISRDNLSKFLNIILRRNSLMLIDYELKTGKKFKKNSI